MEQLGNPGLNWQSLQTYVSRLIPLRFSTHLTTDAPGGRLPSPFDAASSRWSHLQPFVPRRQGSYHHPIRPERVRLPLQSSPPLTTSMPSDLERQFNTTVLGLGLPYAYDLTCGNPAGASPIANTRSSNTRIDACESSLVVWRLTPDRGYLYRQNKPNLTSMFPPPVPCHPLIAVLSGANVGKVILSSSSTPRATGVQFRDEKGNTYSASARLEVIMAAGAIKTPVILQQSGIGPGNVLSSAGIQQRVDLPVGLNLIDQTTVTTDWNFQANRGGGQPITFPRFQVSSRSTGRSDV